MAKSQLNLNNLDVAKFICSLLIIIIHTAPLQNLSKIANFYVVDVLARIAVPLYFSISGFLFFRKLVYVDGKIKSCSENYLRLVHYVKHIAHLYVIWSAVYIITNLPEWYRIGWWGISAVKDVVISFFVRGSYYHLWYLLASIYAVPILYLLLKYIRLNQMTMLTGILWLMECLTYSYSWIGIENIGFISLISQKIPIVFDSLFRAVPLLTIGTFCAFTNPPQNIKKHSLTAILCFVLCVVEASFLYFCTSNEGKYSYLVSTPFFTYATLNLLVCGKQVNISVSKSYILRNAALIIYCLHPLIINLCTFANIPVGIAMWGVTTVTSIILAEICSQYKANRQIKT